ncbi:MAG: hypothetical protein JWQ07_3367 [Ramlibacter sp.]|nr:hypothetical protein [Ramlibacter sp.]
MTEKSPLAPPEIYWVIGDGTDVGKTTIASALVRVLNRGGTPTVGFKPYAAALLRNLVDLMVSKYPSSACKLYGADALALAEASPLTTADHVDLVSPVQYLCHPDWPSTLMVRTGSSCLGNTEYFASDSMLSLAKRGDIQALIERSGLPLDQSVRVAKIEYQRASALAQKKVQQAFGRLVEMGPATVVCEGAAMFLPSWAGCPEANSVFFLSAGMVHLFPNLNLPGAATAQGVAAAMKGASARVTAPLYMAESRFRDKVAEQIVTKLLEKSGRPIAGPGRT